MMDIIVPMLSSMRSKFLGLLGKRPPRPPAPRLLGPPPRPLFGDEPPNNI